MTNVEFESFLRLVHALKNIDTSLARIADRLDKTADGQVDQSQMDYTVDDLGPQPSAD